MWPVLSPECYHDRSAALVGVLRRGRDLFQRGRVFGPIHIGGDRLKMPGWSTTICEDALAGSVAGPTPPVINDCPLDDDPEYSAALFLAGDNVRPRSHFVTAKS